MKLNNKGMAISGILYSILVLFLVLLFGILALLASGKYTFDKLKTDITSKLSNNVDDSGLTDASCFQFNYNTQTITKYNFSFPQCGTNVVIPESINNVIVKYIAAGAFYGGSQITANKLTSVDFSNAVYLREVYGGTSYADGAFSSNNITSVNFGELLNLIKFGDFTFYGNNISGEVDLSGVPNINDIPNYMFYGSGITKIKLSTSGSITTIGAMAFYGNDITGELPLNMLPNLTSIGPWAFANNKITSLNTSSLTKLTSIGDGAFHNNLLETVNFGNLPSLTVIGNFAFSFNQFLTANFSNNSTLTTIGTSAFQHNTMTSVTFGSSSNLTTIGASAFSANNIAGALDLTGLTKINSLPDYAFFSNSITSVSFNGTSIGAETFAFNKFANINFSNMPNLTTINAYAFFKNTLLTTINLNTLANLTTIGYGAFGMCALTAVSFPNSITTISDYAFDTNAIAGAIDLSSTTNKVTIGIHAFAGNQITSLNLSTHVSSIGGGAFNNNKLPDAQANIFARTASGTEDTTILVSYGGETRSNIVMPASVTTLAPYAYSRNSITSITFSSNLTAIGSCVFGGNNLTGTVDLSVMPNLTNIGSYAFTSYPSLYSNYASGYTTSTSYGYYGYNSVYYSYGVISTSFGQTITTSGGSASNINFTGLTKLTTIGDYAFSSMGITTITGLDTLTSLQTIGSYTFSGNIITSGLTFTNLTNLQTIGSYAFSGNNYSGELDLSKTLLTSIATGAFYRNNSSYTNTTTIKLPNTVTSIGSSAFYQFHATSVVFPSSLTSIGTNAFQYNNLSTITLPATLTTIGSNAFSNNSLTTVSIPSSVTSLGTYAFSDNSITGNIDLSTLNPSIKTIPGYLFYNNQITSLTIGSNITTISSRAFYINRISSITIPVNVISIGSYAFKQNDTYPWSSVTIEHNETVLEWRFSPRWTGIGWPESLMPPYVIPEILLSTTNNNDFSYVGTYAIAKVVTAGYYQIQAWGARSDPSYSGSGNYLGGYASGIVHLEANTELYVYVASKGDYEQGGYNGGGNSYAISCSDNGAGGGATDIRLVSGTWNSSDGLLSRIIVAGGGGGGRSTNESTNAGTETGSGGTQTKSGTSTCTVYGGFGYGALGDAGDDYAGGGGGWYGGCSQGDSYAGGGSNYVFTYNSTKPEGYTPTASYQMTSPISIPGNAEMPKYSDTGTMIGNSGDGYARITYIGESS